MATTMNDSPHINWTYNDTLNYLSCDLYGSSINTADLTNDGVTYAKIQNVTDNRLLGRSAGSAGDVQEITVGTGLALAAGVLTADYASGTFTVTATGFAGTVSGTARWARSGAQVVLALPDLTGTSNATTFTLTGMPAGLASGSVHRQIAVVESGAGVYQYGTVLVNGTALTVQQGPTSPPWTASGVKSLYAVHLSYLM